MVLTLAEALQYAHEKGWQVQDDVHIYPWEPLDLLQEIKQHNPALLHKIVKIILDNEAGIYTYDNKNKYKLLYKLVFLDDYEDE